MYTNIIPNGAQTIKRFLHHLPHLNIIITVYWCFTHHEIKQIIFWFPVIQSWAVLAVIEYYIRQICTQTKDLAIALKFSILVYVGMINLILVCFALATLHIQFLIYSIFLLCFSFDPCRRVILYTSISQNQDDSIHFYVSTSSFCLEISLAISIHFDLIVSTMSSVLSMYNDGNIPRFSPFCRLERCFYAHFPLFALFYWNCMRFSSVGDWSCLVVFSSCSLLSGVFGPPLLLLWEVV